MSSKLSDELLGVWGGLSTALSQSIDSDDQIIVGHIREAVAALKANIDRVKELERVEGFAHWVLGASDCRLNPILEMINDKARQATNDR